MYNTVSARQIQREYKKILKRANRSKKPIIVISNNKPQGAVIGLDLLEKIQLDLLAKRGLDDYRAGRTKSISTEEELEEHFREIDEMAKS